MKDYQPHNGLLLWSEFFFPRLGQKKKYYINITQSIHTLQKTTIYNETRSQEILFYAIIIWTRALRVLPLGMEMTLYFIHKID
jgi:hypothetical protein